MYDSSLKHKWDNKNVLDYAVSTAEAKGRHEEALTIAREMKKDGLPLVQISKFTKLSIEEIEKL
jgi:predicted transposase YdaD